MTPTWRTFLLSCALLYDVHGRVISDPSVTDASWVKVEVPQPKQFPDEFHAFLNRAITVDGTLKVSNGGIIDADHKAGYICRTDIGNIPPENPIPPAEQGSVQRSYHNMSERIIYHALLHKNGTSMCWTEKNVSHRSYKFPENMTYAGQKEIIDTWVDDYNKTNFLWNGTYYTYMEYGQATQTEFPVIFITQIKNVTKRSVFVGLVPQSQAADKIQCNYTFVSQKCPEVWCRSDRKIDGGIVGSALGWVCGQPGVDCTDINEGGKHYLPNDVWSHGDWAFTQYYKEHAADQGTKACCFSTGPDQPCAANIEY
eukprot:NODE_4087_length_1118_cov_12.523618_g3892_i0.p1 GENE.NODE_4087_length_1118_cov_12.523618_g3892_i0~~NODE_4087_length_1118_cov_12.523618_g3892_i0.p1  ORF type:complete len:329 (-),score=46.64 NODE_4087_length_1118_cov_12.523618_g3892_i0:130-1065(-)